MPYLYLSKPSLTTVDIVSRLSIEDGFGQQYIHDIRGITVSQLQARAGVYVGERAMYTIIGEWESTTEGGLRIELAKARAPMSGDNLYWYGTRLKDITTASELADLLRRNRVTIGNVKGPIGMPTNPEYSAAQGFWRVRVGYDQDNDRMVALYTGTEWVFAYATMDSEDPTDPVYGRDGTNSSWKSINQPDQFMESPLTNNWENYLKSVGIDARDK